MDPLDGLFKPSRPYYKSGLSGDFRLSPMLAPECRSVTWVTPRSGELAASTGSGSEMPSSLCSLP